MKKDRIMLLAFVCLAFSTINYGLSQPAVPGQSQVHAYTLPLPLDKSTPMERFDIDNIVDEAFSQSMQEKVPSDKKSKKQKKNDKILKRSNSSITFVVDGELPAPKKKLTMHKDGKALADQIVGNTLKIPSKLRQVVKTSFDKDEFCYMAEDNFYKCMVQAYADHRPVVLSPDIVWLIIAQNFSAYVNANSDVMRDYFVTHEGKMDLVVDSNNDILELVGNGDWELLLNDFSACVAQNTKGDVSEMLTANFTTTGITERIASQITLIDVVKTYFNYWNLTAGCGIPYITLEGTPEDWQKVREKARGLSKYGLEKWSKELDEILTEFVKASEGSPNQAFWQNIVKKTRVDELKSKKSCGVFVANETTKLDGWFLRFFIDKVEGTVIKEWLWAEDMPSEIVRVPFKHAYYDPATHEILKVFPMELWAGFVGVEEDTKTKALTPKIGWFARHSDEEAEELSHLKEEAKYGLQYTMNEKRPEVPATFSRVDSITNLDLTFKNVPVNIPAWMDNIEITNFTIRFKGNMSEEEEVQLRQRFPQATIINDEEKSAPIRQQLLAVPQK
ncbi:MAG: DUF4419 domain-containing protein [Bacteroidaceae bacterium]|nr:DUF4419 domain-containing protein [Bacteroidaceae bacterium]